MTLRPSSTAALESPKASTEDAFFADDAKGLYAVSDGVGGHKGGEVASRLAIETVAGLQPGPDPRADLTGLVARAARALHAGGASRGGFRDMAATLTALAIRGDAWHLVHIGDSRAYLYRGGELEQLSSDHTIAWEQFRAGAFSKDRIADHPNQKLLTRCLLASRTFAVPDHASGSARPGDLFVLVTDGVNKVLPDDRIAGILAATPDAAALVQAAARAGADDDATAIVISVASR